MKDVLISVPCAIAIACLTGCATPTLQANYVIEDNKLYVWVTNIGEKPVSLEWVEIFNGDPATRDQIRPGTIRPGQMRVVYDKEFECMLPMKVLAGDRDQGELRIPIATVPTNLPKDAETRCTLVKGKPSAADQGKR